MRTCNPEEPQIRGRQVKRLRLVIYYKNKAVGLSDRDLHWTFESFGTGLSKVSKDLYSTVNMKQILLANRVVYAYNNYFLLASFEF